MIMNYYLMRIVILNNFVSEWHNIVVRAPLRRRVNDKTPERTDTAVFKMFGAKKLYFPQHAVQRTYRI